MSLLDGSQSSPEPNDLLGAGMTVAYAGLLSAHEHGATVGTPILSDVGVCYVRRLLLAGRQGLVLVPGAEAGDHSSPRRFDLPHWDADSRQLWLGGFLLKEFRKPAPHQTGVLSAFQNQGWQLGHIPNPLVPEDGDGPDETSHRLHETIKNLNRGLPNGTIHFRGDGSSNGVCWEFSPAHREQGNGLTRDNSLDVDSSHAR